VVGGQQVGVGGQGLQEGLPQGTGVGHQDGERVGAGGAPRWDARAQLRGDAVVVPARMVGWV
jgi:predicted secreted protein